MRKLFTIIFCFCILFLMCIILSLVPLDFIGNKFISIAKKQNVEFYSKGNWNFRIQKIQATTSDFEYQMTLGKNKIVGHGKKLVFGLIDRKMVVDNLVLEVHIAKGEDLQSVLNYIMSKIQMKNYSFLANNLAVYIFYDDINDNKTELMSEFLVKKMQLTKTKKNIEYSFIIGVNKNEVFKILFTANINNKEQEINGKIDSNDIICYLYGKNNNSTTSCYIKNLLNLMTNFGFNTQDENLKKILNKTLELKTNTTIDDNRSITDGTIKINDDVGKLSFSSDNNILQIDFDKIDFDKQANNEEKNRKNFNEQDDMDILAMSGKENKFINDIVKEEHFEDVNSLSKIFFLIHSLPSTKGNANTRLHIKQATINTVDLHDVIIDVKNKDDDKKNITLKKIEAKILETDNISIEYTSDRLENLLISGSNIENIRKLFDLNFLNPELLSNKYNISGNISITTDSIELKDIILNIDENKILQFDYKKYYDFDKKALSTIRNVTINNIDLDKYLNTKQFYQNIHDAVIDFQAEEKQDAIIWKHLFNKRTKNSDEENIKDKIIFNNVIFANSSINNFSYEMLDNRKRTEISVNSTSDVFSGSILFKLQNIDGKEKINTDVNIMNFDTSIINNINNGFQNAVNKTLREIFFADRDYNIPSFTGLNGDISLNIDKIQSSNSIIVSDLQGNISLVDGVFETNNLICKYADGTINANIILSMQGRPRTKFAMTGTGLKLQNIISSPLKGYLSYQAVANTNGFNPISFIKNIEANGRFVVQNLEIPTFNLLGLSAETLTNGISKNTDYKTLVLSKSMAFQKGEGNFILEGGLLHCDISASREMVSFASEFEFNIFSKILKTLTANFATIISRKKLETPITIYIPVACNGNVKKPTCLIQWKQLNEIIQTIE